MRSQALPISLQAPTATTAPMRLRYGYNLSGCWSKFTSGSNGAKVQGLLREAGTEILRVFLFENAAPDPLKQWDDCAAYLDAVLNTGAVPMINFAGFPRDWDSPGSAHAYARRCRAVVQRSIEHWGETAVGNWYWCLGDEPNSPWSAGSVPFDGYRRIYEETAEKIYGLLAPFLPHGKPRIGGPALDGFQPFWFDWVWRFVNEIDNSLIGFVAWHYYGDWREHGAWSAPSDSDVFRRLLLSRTMEYWRRAKAVARVVEGRGILNICSELGAHSHNEPGVSSYYNQTLFGSAYYGSALIQLMRGGADAELWWAASDDGGPSGAIGPQADTAPAYWAKRLCVSHVRFGDKLCFPNETAPDPPLDIVIAEDGRGRRRAFLAHLRDEPAKYIAEELAGIESNGHILKLDGSTGSAPVGAPFDGTITFDGYGIAAVGAPGDQEGISR